MSDATRRTLRTVIQVIVSLAIIFAVSLIPALQNAGVDTGSLPWLAGFVAVCAAVARASQSGILDQLLDLIGLGKGPDGRHEA